MHKVDSATYIFDGESAYLIGPNGAGKSTVLEAIQLAILGYIPGYAKTNEAIMRHSNGGILSVTATFDDGSELDRTWVRSGSSVKSSVSTDKMSVSLDDLLGEVELPVFNFNEFKEMTANKLKEWFIQFLPEEETSVNWEEEFKEALGKRNVGTENFFDHTVYEVSQIYDGSIESIRSINTYLKNTQSFLKKEVERLAATAKSCVLYDEDLPDETEELEQKIAVLREQYKEAVSSESDAQRIHELNRQIAGLQLKYESVAEDPEYQELDKQLKELQAQPDSSKEINELREDITQLTAKIQNLSAITSDVCPYIHEHCSKIGSIIEGNADALKSAKEELAQFNSDLNTLVGNNSLRTQQIQEIERKQNDILFKYDRLDYLVRAKASIAVPNTELPNSSEIAAQIDAAQKMITKIESNKEYNKIVERVSKEKMEREIDLEALKLWIKRTDANGLQTELMNKPFARLENDMSSYLTQMYGKDTHAKFNLEAKANSFSFGLIQDGKYIEFDYLSSGERCLFTLALIICLLDKSASHVKTILIDDILDHLDDSNAGALFSVLNQFKDTQFILAGVKQCNTDEVKVIEI